MLLVSVDGAIQQTNAAFDRLVGGAPGNSVGTLLSAVATTDPAEYLRRCASTRQLVFGAMTVRNGGDSAETACRCEGALLTPRSDGGPAVVLLRFIPRDVSVARFVTLTQKISELSAEIARRQRAEAQLRLAEREQLDARQAAEAANHAKDQFLATLSHELRTPLNAILGWTRMLIRGTVGGERRRHGLDVIERNAELQARLVEDLLDVSRIASGNLQLRREPVKIAEVIAAAVDSVRPAAAGGRIHLTTSIAVHSLIEGDFERLQQVLWNLLINAVKFTPPEGRISVEATEAESIIRIVVRDSGEGFPADFKPLMFEAFRQADPSFTRPHGGLGLGLTIARRFVEAQNGTIDAHSDGKGQGAAFIIELPAAASIGATESATCASPAAAALAGLSMLVVDDEPDSCELMHLVLNDSGATVVTAASAAAALEVLRGERIDVVLTDIGMPHRDGFWLLSEIRGLPAGQGREVLVIAVTAFASAGDRHAVRAAGFDGHAPKPVELEALAAAVADARARAASPTSS